MILNTTSKDTIESCLKGAPPKIFILDHFIAKHKLFKFILGIDCTVKTTNLQNWVTSKVKERNIYARGNDKANDKANDKENIPPGRRSSKRRALVCDNYNF